MTRVLSIVRRGRPWDAWFRCSLAKARAYRGVCVAAGIFLRPGSARPVRYLGFPWQMARWLLSPRYSLVKSDPKIVVLGIVRGAAAIVSLLVLKFTLRPPSGSTVPEVAFYGPWLAEVGTLV